MSPTTPATSSNLLALKGSADFAATTARLYYKQWLTLHRRLFLLKLCERHAAYANLPLQINAKALSSCRCKPMRECLQVVVKLQRDLHRSEKQMKEWAKKEIGLHRRFRDMAK
jgi:hypothetical protein